MTLDPEVVQRRLALLREVLADLRGVGHVSIDELIENRVLRRAVERMLMLLVDTAVSINTHLAAASGRTVPPTYRESFLALADLGVLDVDAARELAPSAGFRNVLAHGYVDVDLYQIHAAIGLSLAQFPGYVRAVADFIAAHQDG